MWEPFGSYLLIAQPIHSNWVGLTLLFNRYFLNYFIKNPQTTIALPILTHNVSAIGGVQGVKTVYAGGGGVKKWQNSVYVVVECPLIKTC